MWFYVVGNYITFKIFEVTLVVFVCLFQRGKGWGLGVQELRFLFKRLFTGGLNFTR